jgi:hypothetical protein
MRNPGGQLLIYEDGRERAYDSMTCAHCMKVTFVRAKQKPEDLGGLCKVCMGLICSTCVGQPCKTVEQRLAEEEASYEARRSYGF